MKKLLVLVALTMVMFTGCGSEETNTTDVNESTQSSVEVVETVEAPSGFVPMEVNPGEQERDLLISRALDIAVNAFIPSYMEELSTTYNFNGSYDIVYYMIDAVCSEIRGDVRAEMKVLDEVTEELIIETMTARLEDEVSLEAAIALAGTDMQTLGITRIGDETPEATATPAPVVPEEPSKVEYRDTVDADVTEWLANYETRLPDTLDNVTIIGVCLNDSNNAIVEVYFTDSTGTGYTCTSYGLQLCKPDFAEKFSLPGCHLVVYNG